MIHNHEVAGSIPAPATKKSESYEFRDSLISFKVKQM